MIMFTMKIMMAILSLLLSQRLLSLSMINIIMMVTVRMVMMIMVTMRIIFATFRYTYHTLAISKYDADADNEWSSETTGPYLLETNVAGSSAGWWAQSQVIWIRA